MRAMIVDDEQLSLSRLNRILTESGEISSCHMFQQPLEAYEFVRTHPIDVAFLDINMPDVNGMRLSALLTGVDPAIHIVFVTGYDEYAVQAFDMDALDYLLKPVTAERLKRTLGRIKKLSPGVSSNEKANVQLFNGFKVCRQDQLNKPLKFRSPKTEELLAYLICKRSVTREEIIDALWHDMPPEKAWKNLNSTLYYVRKVIKSERITHFIHANKNGVQIDEGAVQCDLYRFERLIKKARISEQQHAELFAQLETIYSGALLKGKTYNWAGELIYQIEHDYIEVLEYAARYHKTHEQPLTALHYYHNILKIDGIREDISYEVIRLYIKLNRQSDANKMYDELEAMLQRELGVQPELNMDALYTD